MRKWSSSTDDEYCLFDMVSRFRYPKRMNSVLMGANYNASFVKIRNSRSPSTIYKNSKNIERTLFWSAKIKTRTLSENVKIDPQEYVYQRFPLSLLSTKTPWTYNELCFNGWNLQRELCLRGFPAHEWNETRPLTMIGSQLYECGNFCFLKSEC